MGSFSGVWRDQSALAIIDNCPLGKVLTYKNLIYLLNSKFLTTFSLDDQ